ncbi:adenine phosphoribosyltransferase [Sporanaerobium hydrogeniformans]|uniref:Adenine phosphoribosyltransferase n=1 Tax=Sporanaerobium hydrogeniformans TaxID=3072179 RepID=A0AC61DD55_9FIRM|nr:phosphoribosyltransferase family protein [Sporanaerobium hydrogeniformans]PHV70902.1 adenine phosphoribosyltransferase [Sporanaerobium hydrogeniformans]
MEKNFYEMNIVGCIRQLPRVRVADHFEIASFVLLGDTELVVKAAAALAEKIPEVDYLITAEAKGIPLVQELARILNMKRYFVARKSIKPYMTDPFITEVYSITTQKKQILCLDKEESNMIRGKKILIVDDVISTGESLKALEALVTKAGGKIAGKAAILAEGDAAHREDILFLEPLPLFPVTVSR